MKHFTKHDDMVDACSLAFQCLIAKLTLWQKIVKWFRAKIKLLKQLMKAKNPYLKYKNPDSRCWYPFEPDPLGYCWGYAQYIDMGATKEEIIKDLCRKENLPEGKCEYWNEK